MLYSAAFSGLDVVSSLSWVWGYRVGGAFWASSDDENSSFPGINLKDVAFLRAHGVNELLGDVEVERPLFGLEASCERFASLLSVCGGAPVASLQRL